MEKIEDLVRRFQRSFDQHERELIFGEIYARYVNLVQSAVLRHGAILPEAVRVDKVQEAMIVAAKKLDGFIWSTEKKFNAWLYSIAANSARDASRKRQKEASTFVHEDSVKEMPDTSNPGEQNAENAIEKLFELWNEFDPEGFEINYQFHTEGQMDKGIAELLGISPDAARKKRTRALNKFTDYLLERFDISSVDEWIENYPYLNFES